jgi:hypothetical protein
MGALSGFQSYFQKLASKFQADFDSDSSPGEVSHETRFFKSASSRSLLITDFGSIDTPPLTIAEMLPSERFRVATIESICLGATSR